MIGRLVVLLIVANVAWAAWSQGWLRALGLGPATQAEPQRLEQQVRPEMLRVQPQAQPASASPSAAPSAAQSVPATPEPAATSYVTPVVELASAPAPAEPKACLQAGQFDEPQIAALRRAAAGLPDGSWRLDAVNKPGRWMVYVGKLADADAVRTKRTELRNMGVDTDRPGAAMEPGLSLGRFSSEEAAQRALTDLNRKGVRTARVVQERREAASYWLRLPSADAALRQQASSSLKSVLEGKDFSPCDG